MRKPHPSYEMFLAVQKPKYEMTFVDWYKSNCTFSGISTLDLIYNTSFQFYETSSCFKDPFAKKLIICDKLFQYMISVNDFGGNPEVMKYSLGNLANIMDVYEDIIELIVSSNNVQVTSMPSGFFKKDFAFTVEFVSFDSFEQLKDYFENGFIIVYSFTILENGVINMRAFKHEPLTRRVIFEKNYDAI